MKRFALSTLFGVLLAVVGAPAAVGAVRADAAPARGASPAQAVTLTVVVEGRGVVASSPAAIDCGFQRTICSAAFAPGTRVTLTAMPGVNWNVWGWQDGCAAGQVPQCTLTMTRSTTVRAIFIGLDVTGAALNGRWRESLFFGSANFRGAVSHQAELTMRVLPRTGTRVLAQNAFQVPAPGGAFTRTVRLPSGLTLGTYRLSFTGTIQGRPFQTEVPVQLPAPREGVVRDAWISPTGTTRRLSRLRSARSITAFFLWQARPTARAAVVTTWFYNGRKTKIRRTQPRFLPAISHVLRFSGGRNLPRGNYKSVLTVGGKVVKTATIRVG